MRKQIERRRTVKTTSLMLIYLVPYRNYVLRTILLISLGVLNINPGIHDLRF